MVKKTNTATKKTAPAKERLTGFGPFDVPLGFRGLGMAAGLKASGRPDLTLFYSDFPCRAAAVFTKNKFAAAPITVCRESLRAEPENQRVILVNSGQANACTGKQGLATARAMAACAAKSLGLSPKQVMVASTGVIGQQIALAPAKKGITTLAREIASRSDWEMAARGIMTTDTFPKAAFMPVRIGGFTVKFLGFCKGAGMIHPNMATLLSFVLTDANIEQHALQSALSAAVATSFNMMTVDGDTSTNDTLIVHANGMTGNPLIRKGTAAFRIFSDALQEICERLAKQIARDGEGATKFVEISVVGAANSDDARAVAKSIATSNLVKTAIFGGDPNWGRIACAIGNAPARLRPQDVVVRLGGRLLFAKGGPAATPERLLAKAMKQKEIRIEVNLGAGRASATAWTCDLTYDYVRINADYRT